MTETNDLLTSRGLTINKVRLNPRRTVERKEHIVEIKEETKEEPKIWESCCLRVDSEMVQYIGQLVVTSAVIIISTFMLIKADGDCSQSSAYVGLLSFILGKVLNNIQNNSNRR